MKVKDLLEQMDDCVDIAIITNENTIDEYCTTKKKNVDARLLYEEIDTFYIIENVLIVELKEES